MGDAGVAAYLAGLSAERRAVVSAVRDVVNRRLPAGYEEGVQHGMISWHVPTSIYPAGYLGKPSVPLPYVSLASQKSHFALYLMGVYGDAELRAWFEAEFAKAGKALNMGKSCLRFKRLDDLPLDVIGRAVARLTVKKWIAIYEAARARPPARRRS